MAFNDTICFRDYDPVTGPPTTDGFTGIGDDGVITNESEPGYVKGDRLTFGSGLASPSVFGSGSGFPPAVFQGVKAGNFLNLAFFCRFDLGFDLADTVVIAVRPSPGAPQTDARRIDISPLYLDIGADDKNPLTGGPAGDPDTPPSSIGTPTGMDFHVRTDKPANRVKHFRGQNVSGQPWTTTNPGSGTTYTPSGIDIKVRSWLPPTPSLTTTSGQQTIPAAPSTFTFTVADASQFPDQGAFTVTDSSGAFSHIVRYLSKTGNQLKNCQTLTAGIVAANALVRLIDGGWSVEVTMPLTTTDGGTDWITIPDSFGFYFNIIRVGSGPLSQTSQGFYATQFAFPFAPATNYITGVLDATTGIPAYGTGLIPALQSPPNTNLGEGISFLNEELGVGARALGAAPFSPLGDLIHNASAPASAPDNRLVAQVVNTGTTSASDATGIKAEFRFANWGLGPINFPAWAPAQGATLDQPAGIQLLHGSQAEITATWLKANVPAGYAPPHDHQCMWVQLSSTGGPPVNFLESSVRRNMNFEAMSSIDRPATISGVGYPPPSGGASHHDFLLFTNIREIRLSRELTGDPQKSRVRWLWINHGYRRTGLTITINGTACEILDDSPGSFGYVADHIGDTDLFEYSFSGNAIRHLGGNVHSIRVPHGGSVEIQTHAGTKPPGETTRRVLWWVLLLLFLALFLLYLLLT